MLKSIVGPPLKGVADFKSSENPKADNSKDEKKAGSDSFGQVLKRDEVVQSNRQEKLTRAEPQRPIQEKASGKISRADQEDNRRPESDEKVEKLTATKDNGVEKKAKGSGQRQNAILNFMDSFESEFGVPPTRIVEAMANLQPHDQAEAPEETADQVIGQLGLDSQQEDLAKEMYVSLLAQLAQINQHVQQPLAPPLPQVQTEVLGLGASERLAAVQEKRQILNDSLDNMNQKFWMNGTSGDLADRLAQMNMQEKMMQPQGLQMDESLMNAKFADVANQPPREVPHFAPQQQAAVEAAASEADSSQSPQAALAALVAAARAAKGETEVNEPSDFEKSSFAETESSVSRERLPEKSQARGEVVNVVETPARNQTKGFEFGKNQQHQEGSQQPQSNIAKGEILEKTKGTEKSDFKKTLGLEGLQASPHLKQDIVTGAAVAGGSQVVLPPSKAENEANVRQLMNQAQYLIKKGGGEMKVEMTPEGMGKINMKVLVQDGKVNLQMSADTQEAKKILESSLSDLKNSLAAHKLSMDHVKIDVVAGTNTENNTQNQMNQHQGSRDQTRQFWNNFSESFGSPNHQREGFTDLPNLRGYPRPRVDQGIQPVQTASVNKYAAAGKGKGLNLVA